MSDDDWGEVFSKAAGQETAVVVESQPPPRTKKKHKRNPPPVETSSVEHERCLEARTRVPDGSHWTSQLIPHQWLFQIVQTEGNPCPCVICQGSAVSCSCRLPILEHTIQLSKNAGNWQGNLFCCLRNLRCAAKLRFLKREGKQLNTNVVLEQVDGLLSSFPSTSSSGMDSALSSPQYKLLCSKCQAAAEQAKVCFRAGGNVPFESGIRLIMACDEAYYHLYYLTITTKATIDVPHPPEYFGIDQLTMDVCDAENCFSDFVEDAKASVDPEAMEEINSRYVVDGTENKHPLLALHRWRLLESISLFRHWMDTAKARQELWKQVLDHPRGGQQQQQHEVPAPVVLREWRDSCRDFLCHLYAYATVPEAGLDAIEKTVLEHGLDGIVELGAGTGYLGHLLQARGKLDVVAFDVCPTSRLDQQQNEYHRGTPPFMKVDYGTVQTALQQNQSALDFNTRALLLCYPPESSPMAYDALRAFTRAPPHEKRVFIHIGEFKGLTGSRQFEQFLQSHYRCIHRSPCLTWSTDASTLTIWTRRQGDGPVSSLLPCSCCQVRESTKRCRLLRHLEYCGRDCFDKHHANRTAHLRMSLIAVPHDKLNFDNPDHFLELSD